MLVGAKRIHRGKGGDPMSSIYDIEQRRPSAWLNRAITHLSVTTDRDTLHAISILIAALKAVSQ